MKDTRSKRQVYIAAAKRALMWNFLSKKLGLLLVTEFPKSGGSWFCQMLEDASGIPFPRNVIPSFHRSIMHGHHLFHPRMNKAIAILRDGRDVMVSAYFHFLFDNEHNQSRGVTYNRQKLQFRDYDNIVGNMPRFIEYMFTEYRHKSRHHFSWSEFIDNSFHYSDRLLLIKYEELLTAPLDCLEQALQYYDLEYQDREALQKVVDKYNFRKIAQRSPGEENRKSFVRKGISGDWKNYFSEQAVDIFKHYGGLALICASYESDLNWKNSNISQAK